MDERVQDQEAGQALGEFNSYSQKGYARNVSIQGRA